MEIHTTMSYVTMFDDIEFLHLFLGVVLVCGAMWIMAIMKDSIIKKISLTIILLTVSVLWYSAGKLKHDLVMTDSYPVDSSYFKPTLVWSNNISNTIYYKSRTTGKYYLPIGNTVQTIADCDKTRLVVGVMKETVSILDSLIIIHNKPYDAIIAKCENNEMKEVQ